jgi:HAE1 family hydrophobic/amphiphilic exporter-1
MVPYSAFMKLEKVYGLSEITRHNMYTTEISGSAAVGYSSGTAIKVIQEVAAENYQEDMILTGQVYLLMRYHKESSHLGISYLFGFCVFGFSSTIRKFYSALSVILSLPAGILVLSFC